jgi:Putative neutral zinc metallopeptidase
LQDAGENAYNPIINPAEEGSESSDQRVSWFKRGFETGDPGQCNTFKQSSLSLSGTLGP